MISKTTFFVGAVLLGFCVGLLFYAWFAPVAATRDAVGYQSADPATETVDDTLTPYGD